MKTFIWTILLLYKFLCISCQGTGKPVSTFLNAKWPTTPYMLECGEYMAEESSLSFWAFIEEINKQDLKRYTEKNQKEKYEFVIKSAETLLSPSQIPLLEFSFALHAYSPKIESFRQIAIDHGINEKECRAVAKINEILVCDPSEVEKVIREVDTGSQPLVFDIDHVYMGEKNTTLVILYGELGTPELQDFHNVLKKLSSRGLITYVLRPFIKDSSVDKLRMSGYGVELQIKSTEYKAQDDTKLREDQTSGQTEQDFEEEVEGFVFSRLKSLYPEAVEKLNKLKSHLLESSHDQAPLKVWQMQHLSMQAAQRVMSPSDASEQLNLFIQTSQNFPSLARSLIRTKVDDKLRKEILKNKNMLNSKFDISSADGIFSVNGMQFDLDSLDIFSLLDHLKNEQRAVERLFNLGVSDDTLTKLLNLDISETKVQYGIDIRDTAINWLNDIEKDKTYSNWPSYITDLLRPAFPGMLRRIRKNIHNFVIVVDPSSKDSLNALKMVDMVLSAEIPVRFGVVWGGVSPEKAATGFDDAGVALVSAFNFVVQNSDDYGKANYKGFKFILDLLEKSEKPNVDSSDVTSFFKSKYVNEDLEEVFGVDSEFDFGRQLANLFVDKGGFRTFPQYLMNGVPLAGETLSGDELEELILMEVMKNTHFIQRSVFAGELTDKHDCVDWLMSQSNIMPKINDRILSNKLSTFIDMSTNADSNALHFPSEEHFSSMSASSMTAVIEKSCKYITFRRDAALRPLTVWVVGDFETKAGRSYLLEAIKYTVESNEVRVCGISNSKSPGLVSKIIEVSQSSLSVPTVRNFLTKILDEENAKKISEGSKTWTDFTVNGLDQEAFQSRLDNFKTGILYSKTMYSSKVLGIPAGKSSVVANGRVLGAFLEGEKFSEDEFSLLEKFMQSSIGKRVNDIVKDSKLPATSDLSDLHMKITSVLMSKPQSKSRSNITVNSDMFSVIKLPPRDPNGPFFDILAICDPVSSAAQKIGPLVKTLHQVLNANVKIVLNSVEKHSEMPLKSFYRYVLEPAPRFTEDGQLTAGPYAKFTGLSETMIYTQNYDTPDNWLVEPVKSVHDLDNIKLEHVEMSVHSEFELEYLLLEGHCYEQSTGNAPRGLQFTLGTQTNPVMVDTIVMSNLGYFQLKANPGAMLLRLREGRSSDIYYIASHEGTESPSGTDDIMVMMNSFRSHVIKIKVDKKPEKVDEDLLQEEMDENGGLWGAISSTFSQGEKDDSTQDDYINIFSVASGHLYERFLRIMMVSVRKHSSRPVKFWIIKNFLSPTFKDSLSVLAEEIGFEFELVQYKWPRWLHQQREKQRIIWGYKILFLDVLFPLSVKKIIFVDADQVVRADMKELHDLDLGGAPYGFVPFCDSRTDMEGFRFWKHGYWRNHLGSRKYHISALFVVDLMKFRLIAAGDRLRGQYQGLSQDPNSLSNLDQDLPNNMIYQVKIKSLPQDWLWCETWCDDQSKENAKIIDLCNNPMTKEAKLTAAKRIISEWTELDESIKMILEKGQRVPKKTQEQQPQQPQPDAPHQEL